MDEKCRHSIGVAFEKEWGEWWSIAELSETGQYTLRSLEGKRAEIGLRRFDHCSKCGVKLDWKEIGEQKFTA